MIDPIEAIRNHILGDAGMIAVVGTQVAGKHKFGSGWDNPSAAMTIRADGGLPDIYTERQAMRIEAWIYGVDTSDVSATHAAFVTLSRDSNRAVVATSNGNALIYWMIISSNISQLYDKELSIDFAMLFLDVAIAEQDVP